MTDSKAKPKFKNIVLILGDETVLYIERKGKLIPTLIDTEDLELVGQYRWHGILDKTCSKPCYYLCNRYDNKAEGKGCRKLHRLIMDCPQGLEVDHINHDTTDNRKCNLRIVDRFENQQNLRSKSTEQTGVYYHSTRNCWIGNITIRGQRIRKDFKTKEEAIAWRKQMENQRKEVING